MLAEYQFSQYTVNTGPQKTGPITWNDVRRSTEPEFKSKPSSKPNPDFVNFYEEYMKSRGFGGFRPSKAQEDFWNRKNDYVYGLDNEIPDTRDRPPPKSPKVSRECSECGNSVVTRDQAQYFICAKCHWIKYHKEKGEATGE